MSGPGHLRILARTAVAGLLLAATGCGLVDQPAPQPVVLGPEVVLAPPDPSAGAPEVGSCHRLDPDQVERAVDSRPPVPCNERHTTVTYLVDMLPEGTSAEKVAHVRRSCAQALPEAVGVAAPALDGLMLTWAWFEPTGAQRNLGATWFRCDVLALPQAAAARKALPGTGLPVVEQEAPEVLRRCARNVDGRTTFVSCDEEHTHRWVGSVPVEDRTYPTPGAWRTLADEGCRPLVGTAAFVYTYPTRKDWKQGTRRLSCFRDD